MKLFHSTDSILFNMGSSLCRIVLIVCLLLTGGVDGKPNHQIKTKVQDLLPQSAPSVQAAQMLEKRLGRGYIRDLDDFDFDRA